MRIFFCKTELTAIMRVLVANIQTRQASLSYMEQVLKFNAKRAHIQSDESVLSTDGFMMNLLHVLQELARPVNKEKVEIMNLYDAKRCMIALREDEARLNCSKDQLVEWLNEGLNKSDLKESNFSTDIFFLTFNAHYLSITSIIHKYEHRIRVIRELDDAVEKLSKTKELWENTMIGPRNKSLLERWQNKLKVSGSSKNLILFITCNLI